MIPTFMSVTLCNDCDLVSVRYVFECFREVRLDICHRLRLPDATVSSHELEYRSAASAFAYSENKVAGRLLNFQKCAVRDQVYRVRHEYVVLRGYSGFHNCLLGCAVV